MKYSKQIVCGLLLVSLFFFSQCSKEDKFSKAISESEFAGSMSNESKKQCTNYYTFNMNKDKAKKILSLSEGKCSLSSSIGKCVSLSNDEKSLEVNKHFEKLYTKVTEKIKAGNNKHPPSTQDIAEFEMLYFLGMMSSTREEICYSENCKSSCVISETTSFTEISFSEYYYKFLYEWNLLFRVIGFFLFLLFLQYFPEKATSFIIKKKLKENMMKNDGSTLNHNNYQHTNFASRKMEKENLGKKIQFIEFNYRNLNKRYQKKGENDKPSSYQGFLKRKEVRHLLNYNNIALRYIFPYLGLFIITQILLFMEIVNPAFSPTISWIFFFVYGTGIPYLIMVTNYKKDFNMTGKKLLVLRVFNNKKSDLLFKSHTLLWRLFGQRIYIADTDCILQDRQWSEDYLERISSFFYIFRFLGLELNDPLTNEVSSIAKIRKWSKIIFVILLIFIVAQSNISPSTVLIRIFIFLIIYLFIIWNIIGNSIEDDFASNTLNDTSIHTQVTKPKNSDWWGIPGSIDVPVYKKVIKERDSYGIFPDDVNFCYDNLWRPILDEKLKDSEYVIMDLKGFNEERKGCLYEINKIFECFDISKAIFLIDDSTDIDYLKSKMTEIAQEHCSKKVYINLFKEKEDYGRLPQIPDYVKNPIFLILYRALKKRDIQDRMDTINITRNDLKNENTVKQEVLKTETFKLDLEKKKANTKEPLAKKKTVKAKKKD